jgi:cytochrome c oxidase cbb3-type subunit 1
MDRFVKNFIAMSIVYLFVSSLLGVVMLVWPVSLGLKFVHSHLMLLGWVSMMIFGVGYHILPRFAGKLLKRPGLAELQFWAANVGLVGMVVFYAMYQNSAGPVVRLLLGLSGALEVFSITLFFYLIMGTIFAKEEEAAG